jgi:anti-sigma-K factor RskA
LNIKEYISSGIIESYVLGLATEEEVSILECVRKNSPEVQQAILDVQLLMEELASSEPVVPHEELKSTIWNRLSSLSDESTAFLDTDNAPFDRKEIQKRVTLPNLGTKRWLPITIAASVLLVLSLTANILLLDYRGKDLKKMQEVISSNQDSQVKLKEANELWQIIQRLSVKTITLHGIEKYPEAKAVVFWDTKTADVFLSAASLPLAPTGKQYQLWAIVEGQPVDAGLIPLSSGDSLMKMNHIEKAEAFAITLENEGGSLVPTLSEMYVMGNI